MGGGDMYFEHFQLFAVDINVSLITVSLTPWLASYFKSSMTLPKYNI